jgi:hypothetical protein
MVLVSILIMALIISIDYNTLIEAAYYIYGFILIFIVIVLVKGRITTGLRDGFLSACFRFSLPN